MKIIFNRIYKIINKKCRSTDKPSCLISVVQWGSACRTLDTYNINPTSSYNVKIAKARSPYRPCGVPAKDIKKCTEAPAARPR